MTSHDVRLFKASQGGTAVENLEASWCFSLQTSNTKPYPNSPSKHLFLTFLKITLVLNLLSKPFPQHSLSGFRRFIKRVVIGRWVWTSNEIARSVAFLYFPPSLPTCYVYGVFGAWQRLVTILAIIRTSLLASVSR